MTSQWVVLLFLAKYRGSLSRGMGYRILGTILLSISLIGCGSSPSDKDPLAGTELEGTWAGTLTTENPLTLDPETMTITFDLVARQSQMDYVGTWNCMRTVIACFRPGVITGKLQGDQFTATIDFQDGFGGGCNEWSGTVAGETMSGQFACQYTGFNREGSWTAERAPQ